MIDELEMKRKEELDKWLRGQGIRLNEEWPQLGLLMGLSPESSKEYYIEICDEVAGRLGSGNVPLFTAQNVNFGLIETLMKANRWDDVKEIIESAIFRLEYSGARAIAICSNTIHRVIDNLQGNHYAKFIHIGDCVAEDIKQCGLERVGFLGTKFTMTEEFMIKRLEKSGAQIFTPTAEYRDEIDRIIFEELCKGMFYQGSCQAIIDVIMDMITRHDIQGVVLGCTELPLIIDQSVQERFCLEKAPGKFIFFDSEKIHVSAIADFCCGKKTTVAELQEKWCSQKK